LPETERLVERVLVLPTGTGVSTEDIRLVCNIIRTAIENSNLVREQLLHNA
jgi:dTDP-4-amino-4,6-dideoxygalactose transaminase